MSIRKNTNIKQVVKSKSIYQEDEMPLFSVECKFASNKSNIGVKEKIENWLIENKAKRINQHQSIWEIEYDKEELLRKRLEEVKTDYGRAEFSIIKVSK